MAADAAATQTQVQETLEQLEASHAEIERAEGSDKEAAEQDFKKAVDTSKALLQDVISNGQGFASNVLSGSGKMWWRMNEVVAESTMKAKLAAATADTEESLRSLSDVVLKLGMAMKEEGTIDEALKETPMEEVMIEMQDMSRAEDKAEEEPKEEAKPELAVTELKVSVVGEEMVGTEMYYLVTVDEPTETRYFKKTFLDFRKLDDDLRQAANPCLSIPDLPDAAVFSGIMVALNLGDSKRQRRKGLQKYLNILLTQIPSLNDNQELNEFLGRIAPGAVVERK